MAAQEQPVPFMLSRPLNATYRAIAQDRRLRNFDIFDFALNYIAGSETRVRNPVDLPPDSRAVSADLIT
jgi:hypothetical protein